MKQSRKIGYVRVRRHVRDGVPTGKWHLVIPASVTGTGKQKRTLFENRKDAEAEAREITRMYQARLLGVLPAQRRSSVPFNVLAERWKEWEERRVRTLRKRQGSHDTDLARLKYLATFFGSGHVITITTERVEEYVDIRISRRSHSPETINGELRTLRKIMRWGAKNGHVSNLPEFEMNPSRSRDVDIPSPADVARLIAALPARLRVLVKFLAETGCRSGEAFNLTWDCVDEAGQFVDFKPHDGWAPKTSQSIRRVYLDQDLAESVRRLPRQGRYVFPGRKPNRPTTSIKKALATAARKARLTARGRPMKITPHVLRKAHATWLAVGGVAPRVLQAKLGHAPGSDITDRYYVHATDDALRQAAFSLPKLPPVANDVATTGNVPDGERSTARQLAS